jgi:hypothetical protein
MFEATEKLKASWCQNIGTFVACTFNGLNAASESPPNLTSSNRVTIAAKSGHDYTPRKKGVACEWPQP